MAAQKANKPFTFDDDIVKQALNEDLAAHGSDETLHTDTDRVRQHSEASDDSDRSVPEGASNLREQRSRDVDRGDRNASHDCAPPDGPSVPRHGNQREVTDDGLAAGDLGGDDLGEIEQHGPDRGQQNGNGSTGGDIQQHMTTTHDQPDVRQDQHNSRDNPSSHRPTSGLRDDRVEDLGQHEASNHSDINLRKLITDCGHQHEPDVNHGGRNADLQEGGGDRRGRHEVSTSVHTKQQLIEEYRSTILRSIAITRKRLKASDAAARVGLATKTTMTLVLTTLRRAIAATTGWIVKDNKPFVKTSYLRVS